MCKSLCISMQQNSLKIQTPSTCIDNWLARGQAEMCESKERKINSVWILPSTRSESLLKGW